MNKVLLKNFFCGLWIMFAGIVAQVGILIIDNISTFDLTQNERMMLVLILTPVVARITKHLNK